MSVLSAETMFDRAEIQKLRQAGDEDMNDMSQRRRDHFDRRGGRGAVRRVPAQGRGIWRAASTRCRRSCGCPPELTRIPNTPDFIEGVINLRGAVLPVIDQRRRFRMESVARNDRQRIMVFTLNGVRTGFIVDFGLRGLPHPVERDRARARAVRRAAAHHPPGRQSRSGQADDPAARRGAIAQRRGDPGHASSSIGRKPAAPAARPAPPHPPDAAMIKVLVVDDSALMRKQLTRLLESGGGFRRATARNGAEALAALEEADSDVVTLDINMPEMDGLTCLSRIMARNPKPVVMVSSLTAGGRGGHARGARPRRGRLRAKARRHRSRSSIDVIERELIAKITGGGAGAAPRALACATASSRRSAGAAQPRRAPPASRGLAAARPASCWSASPPAARARSRTSCRDCRQDFPWPIVVAQHMPAAFTGVFAARLNDICALDVVEVDAADAGRAGRGLYRAAATPTSSSPGAAPATACDARAGGPRSSLASERRAPGRERARSRAAPSRLIGVQLTGMGDDGAEAMAELQKRGGLTIAQDEATCRRVRHARRTDRARRRGRWCCPATPSPVS